MNSLVYYASKYEQQRLIRNGAAKLVGGDKLRLTSRGEAQEWPCRTHTGRGGMLGAIGRGQKYTVENVLHATTGYKHIDAMDVQPFVQAQLDVLSPELRTGLQLKIDARQPTVRPVSTRVWVGE